MSVSLPNNPPHPTSLAVGLAGPRSPAGRDHRAKKANSQANGITPQLVLYTLLRWWKVALPLGLTCAVAAAAAVWVTFQQEYQASVWVQIYENPQYLVFGERSEHATNPLSVATQLQLLTSPMVMYGTDDIGPQGVVDELLSGKLENWPGSDVPDLSPEDSRDRAYLSDWITRRVAVTRRGRTSELYTISFTSVSPRFAQAIANAIARNYLALLAEQTRKRNLQIIELLEKTNTNRIADLTVERRALGELAKGLPGRTGVRGRPDPESPALGALAGLRASLTTAEVNLELLAAEVQMLEAAGRDQESSLLVTREVLSHPSYRAQVELLAERKAVLQRIEEVSALGRDDPRWQRQQDEVARLELAIDQGLQQYLVQDRDYRLAEARAELEKKHLAVQLLQKRHDELLHQAQSGNRDSLELELKVLEVDRKQEIVGRISERIQTLRTEQAAPDQVILWRWADQPSRPEQLYPTRQLAMAGSAGFAIPFALFVLWELLARRVFNSEHLSQDLDLTVYGEIARLPNRRVGGTAKTNGHFDRSLQIFRDSFDTLSTNLILSLDLREVRVLAVASAVNSEGKTSVAAELARRLAENMHAKVLLIDADMRSPDVHRLFQIPGEPGLADVLARQATLEEAVVTTWSDDLHLLPAGRLQASPVALLGNGNVRAILDQVLDDYRFIIIDTPPVLPTGESLILSHAADATLLCVMCDVSRSDQVRRAYQRLLLSGSHHVGLVVNGVPAQEYQRRYGRYDP